MNEKIVNANSADGILLFYIPSKKGKLTFNMMTAY